MPYAFHIRAYPRLDLASTFNRLGLRRFYGAGALRAGTPDLVSVVMLLYVYVFAHSGIWVRPSP